MPSYPALCPPCGGRAASLGAQNSPSGREDICRSRTARGAGIDGRFPTFLRTCAGIVACSAGICNDQAIQDIEPLCMLSWRFVALAGRQTQQELWAGLGAHPYKGFSAPCPIKHAHRAHQLLPAVPCLSLLARTGLPSPAASSFECLEHKTASLGVRGGLQRLPVSCFEPSIYWRPYGEGINALISAISTCTGSPACR